MNKILVILIVLYLFLVAKTTRKIISYSGFDSKQKTINIVLTFLIPIIWVPIIFSLTHRDPTIIELSKMRNKDMHDLHSDAPEVPGE